MASVSHLSTVFLHVPISSTDNSDLSEDTVQIALVAKNTDPAESDWYNAFWIKSGVAALFIGPNGGALTLAPGAYKVLIRLFDNPEVPVEESGVLYVR